MKMNKLISTEDQLDVNELIKSVNDVRRDILITELKEGVNDLIKCSERLEKCFKSIEESL